MSHHLIISDLTLRDGNHALQHQLSLDQVSSYCKSIDEVGIDVIEVGHGNGLGASSLQVGISKFSDEQLLTTARESLKRSKLGVHVIPGFATIKNDLSMAVDLGVDVFRIACHCSEADLTRRHIEFCRDNGKDVFGVLMMSHMLDSKELALQAQKMESYGAEGVIFMDSSGHFLPEDVTERDHRLKELTTSAIGFHAHNNLGMSVANSLAAVNAGASLIDGCAKGFGAGAGNTPIEVLVAILKSKGIVGDIDIDKLLYATDLAREEIINFPSEISSLSVVSGLSGVFSGFLKPVLSISNELDVNPNAVFRELGRLKAVAGQEDLIYEVANSIKNHGIGKHD